MYSCCDLDIGSVLYMGIIIGPALLFISFFEKSDSKLVRAISIYGRVPFFYYVIHFYVLHGLCTILFLSRGHTLEEPSPLPFRFVIPGEGYSLAAVYLIWVLLVLALYPLRKWFSEYKKRKNHAWLSYM